MSLDLMMNFVLDHVPTQKSRERKFLRKFLILILEQASMKTNKNLAIIGEKVVLVPYRCVYSK